MVKNLVELQAGLAEDDLAWRISRIQREYVKHAKAAHKRRGNNPAGIYAIVDDWVHGELLGNTHISQYTHAYTKDFLLLTLIPKGSEAKIECYFRFPKG